MRRLALVGALALAVACSGGDGPDDVVFEFDSLPVNEALCLDVERADRPVVELVEPALVVVEEIYGAPQRFFEVSVDRHRVSLIVAIDDTAEQVFFCGAAGYTDPDALGEATGATFPGEVIEFDPTSIFDRLDDDLGDPDVVDFAIVGGGDDSVIYDASIRSAAGGVLVVQLSGDGRVLAVSPQ